MTNMEQSNSLLGQSLPTGLGHCNVLTDTESNGDAIYQRLAHVGLFHWSFLRVTAVHALRVVLDVSGFGWCQPVQDLLG